MELKSIVTLANATSRIRFLAMERSLRACGCELPLLVIPYNKELFDLPPNAQWWGMPDLLEWLLTEGCHPMMAKYQCLTIGNYHFVDTDVIFLRNPVEVLAPLQGFVASCGQWRDPYNAVNESSLPFFMARSTLWQRHVFNAGQFACDRALFSVAELKDRVCSPAFAAACFRHPTNPFLVNDQTGLNLLVNSSEVPIVNLNLPPSEMESTWAGDYPNSFTELWDPPARAPYLIHWAGIQMNKARPINELFYQYLSADERQEFDASAATAARKDERERRSLRNRVARGARAFRSAFK